MASIVVPTGSIKAVMAWVGEDLDRARAALAAERSGRERKGLIVQLEQLVASSPPTVAAVKAGLGEGLLADAARLRGQMFAPTVERKAMVTGQGEGYSSVEVVDIDRDEPTFAEKKAIAQTITILTDKAVELLGADDDVAEGGILHDLGAEREARRGAAAQAATPAG